MNRIKKIVLAFIISAICAMVAPIIYLFTLTPNEDYPDDTYLQNEQNKKALIIVAHDDDASLFSGTTSMLAAKGWEVSFLCFYTHLHRPEDNPLRKLEMKHVAEIQGLNSLDLIDFAIARDQTKQGYMPIPYDEFAENYKIDSLRMYIYESISNHYPSVIFILDNIIGYYGHPEHVLVGQVVEEICKSNKESTGFQHRGQQGHGGFPHQIIYLFAALSDDAPSTFFFIRRADKHNGDTTFRIDPFN